MYLRLERKASLFIAYPALLLRAQIPRSNVGQVARVSPTPWVTSQEADITRRAPEARLSGAAGHIRALLTPPSTTPCQL